MCLEAVADSSTAHIQSLVSKQKIPNTKKYATLRRGGPPPQRHRSGPPRPLPSVPANIRKQLAILFKSYPDGLPFTHFGPAFSRRFNCQLQFSRLGFTSMRELLQSVPDLVRLQDFGGEVRVIPGKNTDNERRQQIKNLPPRLQKKYDEGNSRIQRGNEPQKIDSSSSRNANSQFLQEEKPSAPRGRGKKISSSGSTDGRQRDRHVSETSSNSLCSIGSSPGSPEQETVLNSRLADEICKLVQSKDKGIWVTQLQSVYQSFYVKTLNPLDHGYNSMIELCSALPDAIRLERPKQTGDWLLTDSSRPPVCLGSNDSKGEVIYKRRRRNSQQCNDPVIRETIRQVLQCKPSGVMLQELPQLYEELTGESLPWENLGYSSMESFALALADSVLQFEYKGNDQILLTAISTNQPPKTDLLKYAPSKVPNPKILANKPDIPEDAIGPGTFYHQLEFPPCQKFIEVYVSNVISPELQYASPGGNRYRIPEEMISVGLIVAAIFPEDGNWHRCVITSIKCTQYVDTYFVDYGNTCQVHKSNLRLLRSKYMRLPGQALQARLANIQPASEDNLMSLCLTDTSESEDIHINDVLLQEGYARFQLDNHETDFYNYVEPNQVYFSCSYNSFAQENSLARCLRLLEIFLR
ncbi:hypothetical protein FSP39_013328 [Pinctada imbricata]|uniref:Tudor domain-containing protein 5 n=1 Tax=Pinctada imbricata TaxID=66713 RepID=A0AA88XSU0_PINIB|nr:hypothetical protein FSP39_013328 [Pinctada imbricata]